MSDDIQPNPSGAAPEALNAVPISGVLNAPPNLITGKWYWVTYPVAIGKDRYSTFETQLRECLLVRTDGGGLFKDLYRNEWGNWKETASWLNPSSCVLANPQPTPKRSFLDRFLS